MPMKEQSSFNRGAKKTQHLPIPRQHPAIRPPLPKRPQKRAGLVHRRFRQRKIRVIREIRAKKTSVELPKWPNLWWIRMPDKRNDKV